MALTHRYVHPASSAPVSSAPAPSRLQLLSPTTAKRAATHSFLDPLVLWHLLSLDAPTVATVWTVFVAWSAGVSLPWVDPLAMFLAVWILYATDRLLDAQPLARGEVPAANLLDLEERHRFHHRHRKQFLPLLVGGTVLLALLLHQVAPLVLHFHTFLAVLLAGWLLVVHAQIRASTDTRHLPKELAVGIFFPAAVWIPTVARVPELRFALLPGALLFAGVCTLNCLLLYAWEHPQDPSRAHLTTRFGIAHLRPLSGVLLGVSFFVTAAAATPVAAQSFYPASLAHPAALSLASLFSTGSLLGLHRGRHQLPPLRRRALADLVLLTPVLFLPWAWLTSSH